jgi:rfaE bifunctional protein nucleotidyltransferase chain/domain
MKLIKSISDLKIIEKLKKKNKKIVLCHGVFDIVHIGHINYFKEAKNLGDILVVSITEDQFVNKGPGRPSFTTMQRLQFLEQINIIDYVISSNNLSASNIIKKIKPNFYCKGIEYKKIMQTDTKLKEEIKALKTVDGKIKFITTEQYSSSKIINENHLNNFDDKIQNYIKKIKKLISANSFDLMLKKNLNSKILHIGELIIDKYVLTETIGTSGKEATTIIKPIKYINFLGGSGYIANLLSNFVKHITLLSFLGPEKKHISFIKKNISKKVNQVLLTKKNSIVIKKRYIDSYSGSRIIGVYNVDEKEILKQEESKFINKFNSIKNKFDTIILSDFGHDVITKKIIKNFKNSENKIYLNCQINAFSRNYYSIFKYKKVNTLIVNETEFRNELKDKYTSIEKLIIKSLRLFKFKNLIVTQGKNGGTGYNYSKKKFFYYPALNTNPVDTIGAGDTFFSIAALFLSNGIDPEIACFFGNLAACYSVSSLGNNKTIDVVTLKKLTYHIMK